jgi:hypothetical protein
MPAAPLVPILAGACAGIWAAVAAAQPLPAHPLIAAPSFQTQMDLQLRLNALQAQQDLAQREAAARDAETNARLDRLLADQAYEQVRAQAATPGLPAPAPGPTRHIDTSQLADIPDSDLADSDARVRAAAENRR